MIYFASAASYQSSGNPSHQHDHRLLSSSSNHHHRRKHLHQQHLRHGVIHPSNHHHRQHHHQHHRQHHQYLLHGIVIPTGAHYVMPYTKSSYNAAENLQQFTQPTRRLHDQLLPSWQHTSSRGVADLQNKLYPKRKSHQRILTNQYDFPVVIIGDQVHRLYSTSKPYQSSLSKDYLPIGLAGSQHNSLDVPVVPVQDSFVQDHPLQYGKTRNVPRYFMNQPFQVPVSSSSDQRPLDTFEQAQYQLYPKLQPYQDDPTLLYNTVGSPQRTLYSNEQSNPAVLPMDTNENTFKSGMYSTSNPYETILSRDHILPYSMRKSGTIQQPLYSPRKPFKGLPSLEHTLSSDAQQRFYINMGNYKGWVVSGNQGRIDLNDGQASISISKRTT